MAKPLEVGDVSSLEKVSKAYEANGDSSPRIRGGQNDMDRDSLSNAKLVLPD